MKPRIDELKIKKQSKSSEYDLIVSYLKNDYERFKYKSWYDISLEFEKLGLTSRSYGTAVDTYGIVFNTTLLTVNDRIKWVFDVYKIDRKYYLFSENIFDFKVFKRVNKKMIKNKPYKVFK